MYAGWQPIKNWLLKHVLLALTLDPFALAKYLVLVAVGNNDYHIVLLPMHK